MLQDWWIVFVLYVWAKVFGYARPHPFEQDRCPQVSHSLWSVTRLRLPSLLDQVESTRFHALLGPGILFDKLIPPVEDLLIFTLKVGRPSTVSCLLRSWTHLLNVLCLLIVNRSFTVLVCVRTFLFLTKRSILRSSAPILLRTLMHRGCTAYTWLTVNRCVEWLNVLFFPLDHAYLIHDINLSILISVLQEGTDIRRL